MKHRTTLLADPMEEAMHENYRPMLAISAGFICVLAGVWYSVLVWADTSSMSFYRNVIMGGAVILMALTAGGLTALMFYSRRHGYDEPGRCIKKRRE